MKLQYKKQDFQSDAAEAVVKLFNGQRKQASEASVHTIYTGETEAQMQVRNLMSAGREMYGYENASLNPRLLESGLLQNLVKIQRHNNIPESVSITKDRRFTIEMETGTGKTYTYIKTMYELNRQYGWTKFVVVVPSVAIQEGAYAGFSSTAEHFNAEYNKKIRFFVYNSDNLTDIRNYEQTPDIQVMIVNNRALTGKSANTRRIIHEKCPEKGFYNRKPIDVIAGTNPILILDEPQSLQGKETQKMIHLFKPLFMLEYSATPPKTDSLIYRLDALDAYEMKLVKKIRVKGIQSLGTTASNSYVFVERIDTFPNRNPEVLMTFEYGGKEKVRLKTQSLKKGDNLYDFSNELSQYREGYAIVDINAITNEVRFENGVIVHPGETSGDINEEQIRVLQIRETIQSHLKKEEFLFERGIKVLSLFFIDEVAKYRMYDDGEISNGQYAEIFEKQYKSLVTERLNTPKTTDSDAYTKYLRDSLEQTVHDGYFSVDKKGHLIDGKKSKKEQISSTDTKAYDWILKDKESLLSFETPVRFIFSHSALKEGWDNPNVFQICTLKYSAADTRKRQEVGRGMRLCVNQRGERQDKQILKNEVHNVNVLTVIANESYESFTNSLQSEIKEIVHNRPTEVTADYFVGMTYEDAYGNQQTVSRDMSVELNDCLVRAGYVFKYKLTEQYYADKDNESIHLEGVSDELLPFVQKALGQIYNPASLKPENDRETKVYGSYNESNFNKKEFQELWERIRPKTMYTVKFEEQDLINAAIEFLKDLDVESVSLQITTGTQTDELSKETLEAKEGFEVYEKRRVNVDAESNEIKYDLIGELTKNTGLTRKTICEILKGMPSDKFALYAINPEEFIRKSSVLINRAKGTTIIQHIEYNKTDESYDSTLFTQAQLEVPKGNNVLEPAKKHLFDIVVTDSKAEYKFAEELEHSDIVKVYCKLPKDFYINTPLGNYNPDWAIAMEEETVTHIYFVAETKGDNNTLELRGIEGFRKHCAIKHFEAIANGEVMYDIVHTYSDLWNKMKPLK